MNKSAASDTHFTLRKRAVGDLSSKNELSEKYLTLEGGHEGDVIKISWKYGAQQVAKQQKFSGGVPKLTSKMPPQRQNEKSSNSVNEYGYKNDFEIAPLVRLRLLPFLSPRVECLAKFFPNLSVFPASYSLYPLIAPLNQKTNRMRWL